MSIIQAVEPALIARPHVPTIVRDQFVQCEECHSWARLYSKDQHGKRDIPLYFIEDGKDSEGIEVFKWICEGCNDRREERLGFIIKPAEIVR